MRYLAALTVFAATLLALLAWAIPATAALLETFAAAAWGDAMLGPRRFGLLIRGILLALAAAILAQALGAGLAVGFGTKNSGLRLATVWLGLCIVLTPPYLYAYAWSLPLLPEGLVSGVPGALRWPVWIVQDGRAILCLATWTAPIAGAFLACGWRVSGAPAWRLALIDARGAAAWIRVCTGPLLPWLALSCAAVALISSTEYSVPHLCQAYTWNTEILTELQAGGDAASLAWPLLAWLAFIALAVAPLRRRFARFARDLADLRESAVDGLLRHRMPAYIMLVVTIMILAAPIGIFLSSVRGGVVFTELWKVYPSAWYDSLAYSRDAALMSTMLALGCDFLASAPRGAVRRAAQTASRIAANVITGLAIIAALLPPALIGDSLLLAYAHVPWIGDHAGIVSLVGVARYGALAILSLRLMRTTAGNQLTELAATDGAGWAATYFRARLPQAFPAVIAGSLAVALLTFGEVAASQSVLPPRVGSVAITLLNAIHFGRDEQIIALCLCVMGLAGFIIAAGLGILRFLLPRNATGCTGDAAQSR